MVYPSDDLIYMKRCLELAAKGLGKTAPNPMVGCVIVSKGKIIGEGYHREFGGPHAEVNAIASVKDTELLKNATLYVNLEPCSHHGKTPPCSDLIHKHGIPEVVTGSLDPNELVSGKGIKELENHRISIRSGVMETESRELNRRFFTFHQKKRPYVILKWAQSRDGFIDAVRNESNAKGIIWITDKYARQQVHKWRAEEQSILVGTNTAIIDDPQLTAREWPGSDPLRLVIDLKGRLPGSLQLFDGSTSTLVFTKVARQNRKNLEYIIVPDGNSELPYILTHLYSLEIQSLIVEGGSMLLGSFIESGLWDEARVFTGKTDLDRGLPAPALPLDHMREEQVSGTLMRVYRNL